MVKTLIGAATRRPPEDPETSLASSCTWIKRLQSQRFAVTLRSLYELFARKTVANAGRSEHTLAEPFGTLRLPLVEKPGTGK